MLKLIHISAALVLFGVNFPITSFAQDSTQTETASDETQIPALELGQKLINGVAVGTTYTREEFGDWQLRCVLTADQKDPCQLYQLMQDSNGNPVSEISIFVLPPNQPAVAGATIATPLETLLTQQLTLSVDGTNSKRYPFSYCATNGCYARVGLTAEDLVSFRRGSSATVSIVRVVAPNQPVELKMSLAGFTKGFAAVIDSNAANAVE